MFIWTWNKLSCQERSWRRERMDGGTAFLILIYRQKIFVPPIPRNSLGTAVFHRTQLGTRCWSRAASQVFPGLEWFLYYVSVFSGAAVLSLQNLLQQAPKTWYLETFVQLKASLYLLPKKSESSRVPAVTRADGWPPEIQFTPTTGSLPNPEDYTCKMCPVTPRSWPRETELCPGAEEEKEGRGFFSAVFGRLWSLALKMPVLALLLERH